TANGGTSQTTNIGLTNVEPTARSSEHERSCHRILPWLISFSFGDDHPGSEAKFAIDKNGPIHNDRWPHILHCSLRSRRNASEGCPSRQHGAAAGPARKLLLQKYPEGSG